MVLRATLRESPREVERVVPRAALVDVRERLREDEVLEREEAPVERLRPPREPDWRELREE